MSRIVLARQAIYDRDLEVRGYELLFRGSTEDDSARFTNPDIATASVMLHSFLDIGTERVVGKRRAFVNCARAFVVSDVLHPLAPEKFVIEVSEDVPPDTEVVAGLSGLSEQGFQIALDAYIHEGKARPLLDLADIVKLDCCALGVEGVEHQVRALDGWAGQVVVEKIETQTAFERCRGLGVDLFQGHFLTRPQLVRGTSVPASRLTLLRVLTQVNDPNTGLDELAGVIEQDVGLSYTLLRHVNSVLYGLPRRVEKVRDVAMVLGLNRIRSLASLLLLAQIDDKPKDVISTALIRGKMCEQLADGRDGVETSAYFATGLFSTLDALLSVPMPRVLEHLPLVEDITTALLGTRESRLRRCLDCVLAYETGDWDRADKLDVPFSDIGGAYLSALDYATQIETQLVSKS